METELKAEPGISQSGKIEDGPDRIRAEASGPASRSSRVVRELGFSLVRLSDTMSIESSTSDNSPLALLALAQCSQAAGQLMEGWTLDDLYELVKMGQLPVSVLIQAYVERLSPSGSALAAAIRALRGGS
jgi:hypothetical protein